MLKTGLKLPGIDKIFLLNLKHRTDRLLFQKKQFWKLGIEPFIRVEPVAVVDSGNFLNKSIRSVYLSHLKIIEQVMKENITALILEDDAVLRDLSEVRGVLNFLFNKVVDWNMFYFYTDFGHSQKEKGTIKDCGNIQKIKYSLNLHAYIINKKNIKFVYDKLNDFKNKIDQSNKKLDGRSHVDVAMIYEIHPYFNVYGCKQQMIYQARGTFKSDNEWEKAD
jgi:hypothetical protein